MSSSSTDELELGFIRFQLAMQISTKRTASAAWERPFNLQRQLRGRNCYCSTIWANKNHFSVELLQIASARHDS